MSLSSRDPLVFVILFCALLILGGAQRGGSRSSSSSSSSSSHSSHSYYHSNSNYHRNQNCTTINGTTTCTYVADEPLGWTPIFIFLGIFIALIACAAVSAQKDEQRRKEVIDGVMKTYEAKC